MELQSAYGLQSFTTLSHYRAAVHSLDDLAWQTDKGIVLARELADGLRRKNVLLPAVGVMERICAEAITRANRRIHAALTDTLTRVHRQHLDELLKRKEDSKATWLAWLRLSPTKPNSRHMLAHIERLEAWQALDLPAGIERQVHQNRLLKIAREGGQMTPADCRGIPSPPMSQRRKHWRGLRTLISCIILARATPPCAATRRNSSMCSSCELRPPPRVCSMPSTFCAA